jgi:hypothetical protein
MSAGFFSPPFSSELTKNWQRDYSEKDGFRITFATICSRANNLFAYGSATFHLKIKAKQELDLQL